MFIITLCSCRQPEAHCVYPLLIILKRLIFRQWSADAINLSLELLCCSWPVMSSATKYALPSETETWFVGTLCDSSLQHNLDVKQQPRWDDLALHITAPLSDQASSMDVIILTAAARAENSSARVSPALRDTEDCAGQWCTRKCINLLCITEKENLSLMGVVSFSRITSQMFSCLYTSPSKKTPELTSPWNFVTSILSFPLF